MNPGPLFQKKAHLDMIYVMKVAKNLCLHIAYYPINSQGATRSFRRNLNYFTFALISTVCCKKKRN